MHLGQEGSKTKKRHCLLIQTQDIFLEFVFWGPLVPCGVMIDIPRDHVSRVANDGNPFKVSMAALVIKTSAHVLKPQGVDERLRILCVVKLNAKFTFHSLLCWWTQFPILWTPILLILYQLQLEEDVWFSVWSQDPK